MRTITNIILLLIFTLTSCASSQTSVAGNPRWEKLGERTVNKSLDRDEILVTAREGRFNAIKLAFKKDPVNMHKCVIHFRNGGTQEVSLKKRFARGSESRIIDIKGRNRVIRKVVLWYDTKNWTVGRARVELWGRH